MSGMVSPLPFRVEVIEGLKRLRFVLEPSEHTIACDLTWTGAIPAFLEPRQVDVIVISNDPNFRPLIKDRLIDYIEDFARKTIDT